MLLIVDNLPSIDIPIIINNLTYSIHDSIIKSTNIFISIFTLKFARTIENKI